MDLSGDWVATKEGMLGTLLAVIESAEIAYAQIHVDLIAATEVLLGAGRAIGTLRLDG